MSEIASELITRSHAAGELAELVSPTGEPLTGEERAEIVSSSDIVELVVECCRSPNILSEVLAYHASMFSLLVRLGYTDSELEALLDLLQAAWLRLVGPASNPTMLSYAKMKKRGIVDIAAMLSEEELAEMLSVLAAKREACEKEMILDVLMRIVDLVELDPAARDYAFRLAEEGTCSEVKSFASLLIAL